MISFELDLESAVLVIPELDANASRHGIHRVVHRAIHRAPTGSPTHRVIHRATHRLFSGQGRPSASSWERVCVPRNVRAAIGLRRLDGLLGGLLGGPLVAVRLY